jgi:hypothetical protein
MNIALIQPPIFWTTTAPLGPAYLAGELRTAGETATLIDFNIELLRRDPAAYVQVQGLTERFAHDSPLRTLAVAEIEPALSRTCATDWRTLDGLVDEWVSRILRTAPDLVGLSIHEESLLPALLIAYRLRQRAGRDGRPRIIVGGPEAVFLRADPRWIAEGVVDAVIVGEGEGPLREIVARVRAGVLDLGRRGFGHMALPGAVIATESGSVVDDVVGAQLVDIDSIPLSSFEGLPLDAYSFERTFPIVGSRGCPAKCTFCFETVMWARFRLRSVASVVDEIKDRLATYGSPLNFRFNDSLLNGDLDWLAALARTIVEERLEIKWLGNARIHPRMDRRYLQQLANAGLTGLLYGVESGSDKILRRMKKGVRVPDIPRVLEDTYESGIWTHGFFILGFPGETAVEALQTIDLLLDQIEHLDSLVFHDFALPSHLAEYVNFAGRVAMDDPGDFRLEGHVAAVRPWLQTFLASFLEFAHAHGFLHWQRLGAAETRAALDFYRRRWRQSATCARARGALRVAGVLLAELHAQSQRGPSEPILPPTDATLDVVEAALRMNEDDRRGVASLIAERWPGKSEVTSSEVLDVLRQSLSRGRDTAHAPLSPHERFVPQGFR